MIRTRAQGWLAIGITASLVAFAGCGLPTDDQVSPLAAELPAELQTPTTEPPTTVAPTTEPPTVATSSPTSAPPSTVPASSVAIVELQRVPVYYVPPGVAEELQLVPLRLLDPVSIDAIVNQLTSPPLEVVRNGLRSSVRAGLISTVTLAGGIATVDLSRSVNGSMLDSQKRRAIAQIVLTLTSFVSPTQGAIGQVRFTVDGIPIPVIIPNEGSTSPGEPVSFDDFSSLIVERVGSPKTPGDDVGSTTPSGATTGPPGSVVYSAPSESVPAPAISTAPPSPTTTPESTP